MLCVVRSPVAILYVDKGDGPHAVGLDMAHWLTRSLYDIGLQEDPAFIAKAIRSSSCTDVLGLLVARHGNGNMHNVLGDSRVQQVPV